MLHVEAQVAGARDLKQEHERSVQEHAACVPVLHLSSGYIRRAGSVGGDGGIQTLDPPSPF